MLWTSAKKSWMVQRDIPLLIFSAITCQPKGPGVFSKPAFSFTGVTEWCDSMSLAGGTAVCLEALTHPTDSCLLRKQGVKV